jgi:photosystem II stability/assembly factor-like uncharacterized protein
LPADCCLDEIKWDGIQQIDSLNVVAVGEHGLIIRTTDAGSTWHKQNANIADTNPVFYVHFSDSLTGIIFARNDSSEIHYTTNGGINWTPAATKALFDQFPENPFSCQSYGGGAFKVVERVTGRVFSTIDYWKTIDSTVPIPPYIYNDTEADIYHNTIDGNTILAFGTHQIGKKELCIMARSLDGGLTWDSCKLPSNTLRFDVRHTSGLAYDTVIAGGLSNNFVLISTDRGASWNFDSVADLSGNPFCQGVAHTNSGFVAIFNISLANQGQVFVRRSLPLSVKITTQEEQVYCYPNPAHTAITISLPSDRESSVEITDVLGSVLLSQKASGEIKWQPQGNDGIYFVRVATSEADGSLNVSTKRVVFDR